MYLYIVQQYSHAWGFVYARDERNKMTRLQGWGADSIGSFIDFID